MLHGLPLAYLDGGTGSLLFSSALAGALTVGYVVKAQWQLLKARFSRKAVPSETPNSK